MLTDKEYIYTHQTHLYYLFFIYELPPDWIPNLLAKKVIDRNVFWYKEKQELGRKHGIDLASGVGKGGVRV